MPYGMGATMNMRWLVCGSRELGNGELITDALDGMATLLGDPDVVIHGAARGPDRIAGKWAKDRGVTVHEFPADWGRHGRSAGAIRNSLMLRVGQPTHVLAFLAGRYKALEESRGTAHMVSIAMRAGIECHLYRRPAQASPWAWAWERLGGVTEEGL